MPGSVSFALHFWDYFAFFAFFVVLSAIGYWAGRKERAGATEYFLAGKRLPWYVVGGSFIASNISTEHFIGMIGVAVVYGICVAMSEWGNVLSFTLLIWFFIPFLLASQVFTTPEFLEKRFSPVLRQFFALVTIVSNVVAFLAAVLYGGALAIQKLFESELTRLTDIIPGTVTMTTDDVQQLQLWISIVVLGIVAGFWAIYGGLSSVAWTDLFTVVVMVAGGITVTLLGLNALAGEDGTLVDGVTTMIERNRAVQGPWQEAVESNVANLAKTDTYNRLSVIQPASHPTHPWPGLIFGVFLRQHLVQRPQPVHDPTCPRRQKQLRRPHGHHLRGLPEGPAPRHRRYSRPCRLRHAPRDPHDPTMGRRQAGCRSRLHSPDPDARSHRPPRTIPGRPVRSDPIDGQFGPQLDSNHLHP